MATLEDDFDTEALEADLNAALDGDKPQEQAPEGETQEQQEERLYRRDGRRFAAVEKEKDAPGAPGEQQPQQTAEQQQTPAKPPWKPVWYKEEYGQWDKLPEPLRNALREQERNAAQAIERNATPAKAWGAVEEHFAPFKAQIEQSGNSVPQIVDGLISDYKTLATGDIDTKLATFDRLCQTFFGGRSIEQLAYELQQQGYQPAPQPDPYVRQLEQKLAKLEQGLTGIQSSAEQQQRAALQAEIASFAKDKPHFDELKEDMSALMKIGKATSLADAYEKAQWLHPQIRERILADKRKSDVERARAGAQSPRGGPSANGSARNMKPSMSLEEEIGMLLDGG